MDTYEAHPMSAVFYTDGGYQRQYDVGGWGVHGYSFVKKESKTGSGMKQGMPTEAGYTLEAKIPMPVTPIQYFDGIGSITHGGTNNVAELTAAIRALDISIDNKFESVQLIMDSQYVLKSFTEWGDKWRLNGWAKQDGSPVANKELVCDLLAKRDIATGLGITLNAVWVKGHSGNPGNERADMLATHGIISGVNGSPIDKILVKEAKGFWKNAVNRNRLLNLPRLICDSRNPDEKGPSSLRDPIYHMTNIRSADEFIGKRISDAQFAVVIPKEHDPVVKTLQMQHFQMRLRLNEFGPVILNLDEIFKPDIYNMVEQNGPDFLLIDDYRKAIRAVKTKADPKKDEKKEAREEDDDITESIDTPGGTVTLSRVVQPPRLIFRAMDKLDELTRILETFCAATNNYTPHVNMKFTDITSHLYGMVESGKTKKKAEAKILSTITSLTLYVEPDVEYASDAEEGITKIRLSFGLELPDRNTLSAVAGPRTSVWAVTWPESNHAIRFAVIVNAEEGLGIWSSPYANLHFVKQGTLSA
jgi:ribonuclease HI